MKKFYLMFILLPIATMSMAQIGIGWWQFLPADYADNVFQRQTVLVHSVDDATVASTSSLEELWGTINPDYMTAIDGAIKPQVDDYSTGESVMVDKPAYTADDFSGSFAMLSGEQALYVLYNITDDEVDVAADKLELAFAPYAEQYDPGREIYPDVNLQTQWAGYWWDAESSYVWGWDVPNSAPYGWSTVVAGDTYMDMAKYGSWSEAGAYKVELTLASAAEDFPNAPVYTMQGANLDTIGGVVNGTVPNAMGKVFEETATGYFMMVVIPWDNMPSGKLVNQGDAISIAAKVVDFDSDNLAYQDADGNNLVAVDESWGGTTSNEVYWGIAYYGARAVLASPLANDELENETTQAYYYNDQLIVVNAGQDVSVNIHDLNGRTVGTFQGENQIDVAYLNAGYYVANVTSKDGKTSAVKFVKTNN